MHRNHAALFFAALALAVAALLVFATPTGATNYTAPAPRPYLVCPMEVR